MAITLRTLPLVAYVLGATLGALSLVSWLFVARASMPMLGSVELSSLVLFTAIWGVGMVAMMLPSLIPVVYTITVSAKNNEEETHPLPAAIQKPIVLLRASLFIIGYVGTWTLVGSFFYLVISALSIAGLPVSVGSFGFWAGITLAATGLYQFTRFKQQALMKCRSPMSFILTRWKSGKSGAAVMGADYGLFCTRCCWVLMAGLLVVGAMSLPLMGVFALIIFAEKVFPHGQIISRVTGVAFLATGVYLLT